MKKVSLIYLTVLLFTVGFTFTGCFDEDDSTLIRNSLAEDVTNRIAAPGDTVILSIAYETGYRYTWTAYSNNPTNVILDGADTRTATFTMPSNPGTYYFELYAESSGYYIHDQVIVCLATPGLQYTLINDNSEYSVTKGEISSIGALAIPAYYNDKRVTSIVTNAFDFGYYNSISSVYIPDTVKSIGDSAFRSSTNLTNIKIPALVTNIGDSAFKYCTSLTAITVDPTNAFYKGIDGVLYTKDGSSLVAFPGGFSGTFTLPDTVVYIKDSAFNWCEKLTGVTFGNSVESIGNNAFEECYGLTSVFIPYDVTSIGESAFNYCSNLTSVTINRPTPPALGANAFDNTDANFKIYVPGASSATNYKAASGWSDYSNKIESL